jgi:hypothetical protein
MICESTGTGQWRLSFEEPEALFIVNTLLHLRRHYGDDLAQLPPGQRAFWQGTVSAATKEDPALEGARDLLAQGRTELRSDRLALVDNWLRDFELAESRAPWRVDLTTAERDEFVAMLNDRRLLLALEIGLTDRELENDPVRVGDETRRASILEIDVLGHFIVIILGPQIHRP